MEEILEQKVCFCKVLHANNASYYVRYKELQGEGKNPSNHDFKPEWIKVWNERMLELHTAEIKSRKQALRKRLGLPDEQASISFKIGKGRPGNKPAPIASNPDKDPDVIVIDDKVSC